MRCVYPLPLRLHVSSLCCSYADVSLEPSSGLFRVRTYLTDAANNQQLVIIRRGNDGVALELELNNGCSATYVKTSGNCWNLTTTLAPSNSNAATTQYSVG